MSNSQPQVAPQASEAPAVSSNTQATASQPTTIPSQSASPSTAANANANANSASSQGTSIAAATPTPGPDMTETRTTAPQSQTTTTQEPPSFNDKLNAADRYWKFKFALMAVAIITGLIGVGCFGWLMGPDDVSKAFDDFASFWYLWPSLVTWSFSIVWSAICITVFLWRKHTVHPGLRVAMELILWLAFVVTVLFAYYSVQNILDYGLYGGPDAWGYDYSSRSGGDYVLASNNTWVWQADSSYVSSPRDCTSQQSVFPDMHFKNCAEQDAFVNKVWAEKPHRASVNLTGLVCQFFGLFVHFALFVWACVDTHHYNHSKVSKDAEKLAAQIVQRMIGNGAIVPPPRQTYMQPGGGPAMYYQPPPHGYPAQPMYMQPAPGQQPYMMPVQYSVAQQGPSGPAVGVAGPSIEKAARYA